MRLSILTILCALGSAWLAYTDDYGTGYNDGAAAMCRKLTDDQGVVDVGRCVVETSPDVWVEPELVWYSPSRGGGK